MSATHLVIIGAGPGGTGAALEAAHLGARVTLIERDELGGTCLNRGCIPTKTILRSAAALSQIRDAKMLALKVEGTAILDLRALRTRKADVVDELRRQLEVEMKRAHVEVLKGEASIEADGSVCVVGSDGMQQRMVPDALIVATGSTAAEIATLDHSLDRVWTSDEALELTEIPARLVVMGGGVIGVELASAYRAFGSQVTIVELADHVLPYHDARSARTLSAALKKQGIVELTKTRVTEATPTKAGIKVTLSDGQEIEADILLSAVGRKPLLPAGLETTATVPYPWLIVGDAAGGIMLAHFAEAQGRAAARLLTSARLGAGRLVTPIPAAVPSCVYTRPEVASIGLSPEQAKEQSLPVAVGIAKLAANGKALAEGEAEGFVTIVADEATDRILGAQIVGAHAVELIATIAVAMDASLSCSQLGGIVFAHPTISEAIKNAALIVSTKKPH